MSFTIPNKAVTYPFQSRWFQSDVDILALAAGGRYGAIDPGCAVTASVVPAMTVEVASGQVVIAGVRYDISADTVAIPDADPLLPRFDTVVVQDDALPGVLSGVADPAPFPPSPSADTVALAQVFVPAADTAISSEQIVDKRIMVEDPTASIGWNRISASTDLVRTNSAVRTFDPALSFAAQANTKYRVRGAAAWTIAAGSSNVLSRGIAGPASPTFYRGSVFQNNGTNPPGGITLSSTNYTTFYTQTNNVNQIVDVYDSFEFVIHNVNAGTLGMSWGQSIAVAFNLTRRAGSYLEYEVVQPVAVWKLDGFEHGEITLGTNGVYSDVDGTATAETSPTPHGGLRVLKLVAPGGVLTRVGYDPPAATTQCAMSFALYLDDLPAANCTLATFTNANGNGQFRYNQASNRFAVAHNNLNATLVGPTVTADTWYWVDLVYDSSTGTASLTARVNGSGPGTSTRAQASADMTRFNLGSLETAHVFTAYYDDWLMSLDPTDYPFGAHHIESLIPTADGTHNIATLGDFDSFTTTAFNNSTTNGNTFIGHRPLQNANTANQVIRQDLGTTTDYMEFTFENLASGTTDVAAVRTYANVIESGGGSALGEIRLLLSDNTEVPVIEPAVGNVSLLDSTDDVLATMTTVKRMTNDPTGGWDRTKVNGLKARVGFGDNVPDVNFVDLMLEVALVDQVEATPTRVAATAAVATPTVPLSASPAPDRISRVVDIATPTIRLTATATPTRVAAVAAVPTPFAIAGGSAAANPTAFVARAGVPTPTITSTAPSTSAFHYSDGYGQGYETITPEPPVVVAPEPPPTVPTPTLRVRIDFENDVSPPTGAQPTPVWTDVSALLLAQAVTITRGRKRLMERIEAGQLTLMMNDMDRAFDPSNQDSPYFPGVSPDRRIRIEAVIPWETDAFTQCSSFVGDDDIVGGGATFHYVPLFDGLTEEFTYAFPGPGRFATVTVRCSDVLALASRDQVGAGIPAATNVGMAFQYVLNSRAYMGRELNEFNQASLTSSLRDIEADATAVGPSSTFAPMTGLLDLITASGGGNFFIAGDGKPTYRSRAALDTPSAMTFGIDAERYRDVVFSYDNAVVVSDVSFNSPFLTPEQVTDTSSQQRHPGRPAITVETLLTDASVMNERAREVLANQAFPVRYIQRLEVSQVSTDWQAVLVRELWDRIDLSVVLPNGDIISQRSLIEGIEITTNNFRDWTLAWWLSVPPYRQMLTDADKSFEAGAEGTWEAVSNCTIESTNQEWAIWHSGPNHIERQGYKPLAAPHGAYALWLKAAAAGEFFAHSGPYPVEGRATYLVEYNVRQARFLEDTTAIPGYGTTNGGPFRLDLEWYDADDVILSTDIGTEVTSSFSWANWVLLTQTKRAPTGAAFVRVRVGSTRTARSGMFVDDGLLNRIVS